MQGALGIMRTIQREVLNTFAHDMITLLFMNTELVNQIFYLRSQLNDIFLKVFVFNPEKTGQVKRPAGVYLQP